MTLTGTTADECIEQAQQTDADMVEHRIDLMIQTNDIERVYRECTRPIVATNRPSPPGERRKGGERRRIGLLLDAVYAGATHVDIELDAPRSSLDRVIDAAREAGCEVIVSRHFYDRAPALPELLSVWIQMQQLGADIAKIVTMPRTLQQATRVLSLYTHKGRSSGDLIAFGMGPVGKFTRVAALYMGAPFMYVCQSDGQEVAPGQLSLSVMRGIVEALS
ncbi:MAG: type I 3-dehydroquinate dehydratase [Candidatus Thorarchaeota archaeon]|nr:type I 3-dehydroquinate dehydratase [Candidatus Thorarchaeota archaeon]